MSKKIYNAFDTIKANDNLKSTTKIFLTEVHEKKVAFPQKKRFFSLALVCSLALLIGIGSYSLFTSPFSYISIDINPSIELSLNRFDKVITAIAYNADGQAIADTLTLNGKDYTEAIDLIIQSNTMHTYLTSDSDLTFTVASANDQKEKEILTNIDNASTATEYDSQSVSGDFSTISDAHKHGLSLGKYTAYLELSQFDSNITVEDCHNMTMSELHNQINCHIQNEGHSENNSSNSTHDHPHSDNRHHHTR